MRLPSPSGPLTEHVVTMLRHRPGSPARLAWVAPADPLDEQVALFLLQQLSYRPVDGVDPGWEDDPSFLLLREQLESAMEQRLRVRLDLPPCAAVDVPEALVALLDDASGPSLSGWLEERATLDHLREFLVHRSAYQLQEADPHTFALPRLASGPAKTALLELQVDEYGGHEPSEAHAALFAETMAAAGLDPTAGGGIELLPAVTLATNTLLHRLGRSRRLVGACIGHLAVFEMTSVEPMARYAAACRKLLDGDDATRAARFFDVHVAADGFHGEIALERLVRGFVDQYPDDADQVLFGAAALMQVEQAFSRHLVSRWDDGVTSLRTPLPGSALRPAATPATVAG